MYVTCRRFESDVFCQSMQMTQCGKIQFHSSATPFSAQISLNFPVVSCKNFLSSPFSYSPVAIVFHYSLPSIHIYRYQTISIYQNRITCHFKLLFPPSANCTFFFFKHTLVFRNTKVTGLNLASHFILHQYDDAKQLETNGSPYCCVHPILKVQAYSPKTKNYHAKLQCCTDILN